MIVVDAHVHIHSCFQMPAFFKHAFENLRQHVSAEKDLSATHYALLLTECKDAAFFESLRTQIGSKINMGDAELTIKSTQEASSLRLEHPTHPPLYLISGRQIVSQEKMEVLTIGAIEHQMEGERIEDILKANQAKGYLSILPWGFGKWLGKRGLILDSILTTHTSENIYFGDNGNRFNIAGLPKQLKAAQAKGYHLLSGSDPLPLPSEINKVGQFGSLLDSMHWDADYPFQSISKNLRDSACTCKTIGKLEKLTGFVKNQAYMQYYKRVK